MTACCMECVKSATKHLRTTPFFDTFTCPLIGSAEDILLCSMYGICICIWVIYGVIVAKYYSTMEHLAHEKYESVGMIVPKCSL